MKTKYISYFIGTFFGLGYFPFAPGTIATLMTAIIWYHIPAHYFYDTTLQTINYHAFNMLSIYVILFYFLGVYTSTICERKYGKDASCIVIDEVIGYLIAILYLQKTLMICLFGFIFFRVFDIAKPMFINRSQKLKAGWGVMTDDVLAGIASNILLQIIFYIRPEFFI
jgi:phosphatidylglycerophosphatase A